MTLENVKIRLHNHRLIILNPMDSSYETYSDDSYKPEITELNIQELNVQINKVISVDKQKYKIIKIDKMDSGDFGSGYYLWSHILNKSYHFIMPVLGSQSPKFRVNNEFCNCFIGMEGEEEYGEYVYLLYRFNGSKEFLDFEFSLKNHPMYLTSINPDPYHIMYKFRIPERYKEDINLITEGKYSYVSKPYKDRILNFHLNANTALEEILNRSEIRRKSMEIEYNCTIPEDVDLLSVPVVEKEIYLDSYKIPRDSNNFDL